MFHNYYVYILKCKDDSFYVGVTNNMERRLMEHDTGLNTRCYTYSKRPVALMYVEHTTSIHAAVARENR
ncbi:MAG: GIY-YIG nuclease family protein [Flavipsychrobacter sp.]|nr:GIY-YIG nuclease family protein [Flavipsychrobacter sp.]